MRGEATGECRFGGGSVEVRETGAKYIGLDKR